MLFYVIQSYLPRNKTNGFTLTELIIVIVALGILATIAIAVWGGVQTWSQNKARLGELQQWASAFDTYKAKYAYYPSMPTGSDGASEPYCLGTFSKTSSRCGEYGSIVAGKTIQATNTPPTTAGTAAETIRTELAKVGNVPTNSADAVNATFIGPYIIFNKSTAGPTVTIVAQFVGIFKGTSCPSETTAYTSSDSPAPPTSVTISGDAIACKISRSFTYSS